MRRNGSLRFNGWRRQNFEKSGNKLATGKIPTCAKLPPERFIRVHRSVIVNLDHIARLEPAGHGEYDITLRSGKRVTSSRTHHATLRALLQ